MNVFPKWTNRLRSTIGVLGAVVVFYAVALFSYGASPKTLNQGYAPEQPIPFSHALHAGELGLDCRYCHTTVEVAARAAVPPTETCLNCHRRIKPTSDALTPLMTSAASGEPVHWKRVHDLPDYVYFDHSAHVTRGIGCESCHGRIDTMERVRQVEPLSMGWCLECHRDPYPKLRPVDQITTMGFAPDGDPAELGRRLAQEKHIAPSTDCSTCHR